MKTLAPEKREAQLWANYFNREQFGFEAGRHVTQALCMNIPYMAARVTREALQDRDAKLVHEDGIKQIVADRLDVLSRLVDR